MSDRREKDIARIQTSSRLQLISRNDIVLSIPDPMQLCHIASRNYHMRNARAIVSLKRSLNRSKPKSRADSDLKVAIRENAFEQALNFEDLKGTFLERLSSENDVYREAYGLQYNIALYRAQSLHNTLCLKKPRRCIPVYVDGGVNDAWRKSVEKAISSIRLAAPGIDIISVRSEEDAIIVVNFVSKGPHTVGDIWSSKVVRICLVDNYAKDLVAKRDHLKSSPKAEEIVMQATCTHELLHALGFEHEHQTMHNSRHLGTATSTYESLRPLLTAKALTRFDPHSIMLYPDLPWIGNDPAMLHQMTTYNTVLSELDKVGLNIIFPPREGLEYCPQKCSLRGTDMFYCFRRVMETHNQPKAALSNGICGGDKSRPNGPNCPACRTLICERNFFNDDILRWQGWSGIIYCVNHSTGLLKSHGQCGPDNGPACQDCLSVLRPLEIKLYKLDSQEKWVSR